MNDSALLRLINTTELYRRIRPLLMYVRVKAVRDYGPVYAGLPAASYARNAYDADGVLLGAEAKTWQLWSTYVHDSLCGRYSPRRAGSTLDRQALDRFVAALAPNPETSRSTARIWDRNNASLFPAERVVVYDKQDARRGWTDVQFRELVPLYHRYGNDRRFGVPMDQNALNIYGYLFSFSGAAMQQRSKIGQVAALTVSRERLLRLRDNLTAKLSEAANESIVVPSNAAATALEARFDREVKDLLARTFREIGGESSSREE